MNSYKNKIRSIIIQLVIALLITECLLHAAYRIKYGSFLWTRVKANQFNVRDFTYLVSDARYVTLQKNYNNSRYLAGGVKEWDIHTDDYGFRVCSEQRNEYDERIVFIGDSIPFGWGINSNQSIPCKVEQLLREKHKSQRVINAAIPSYSLDQAVERYRIEIANSFKVNTLIVQTYDPISAFAFLGRDWKVSSNWTTLSPVYQMSPLRYECYRYSIIYHILDKTLFRRSQEALDVNDMMSRDYYSQAVVGSLNRLNTYAAGVKKIVLISPVITSKKWAELSPQHRYAIALTKDILKSFAMKNRRFIFIDAMEYLWKYNDDEGLFVDSCCHVSESGAQVEAELIVEHLER